MQSRLRLTALTVALTAAPLAQAALIDRGGGMIYDTTRDITWLADMNYAATSGYAAANAGGTGANEIRVNGQMGWAAATNWANNLMFGGFDDWRLASLNPGDTSCNNSTNPGGGFPTQYYGYDCTGGEISHLFVSDLGNKAGEGVLDQAGDTAQQIANLALFSNVQSSSYWSGVAYAPNPNLAWVFDAGVGNQLLIGLHLPLYALAVRPGDVAATVPEPQTLALTMLALAAAIVARRKRPL